MIERRDHDVEEITPLKINTCDFSLRVGGERIVLGLSSNERLWMSAHSIPLYRNLEKEDMNIYQNSLTIRRCISA